MLIIVVIQIFIILLKKESERGQSIINITFNAILKNIFSLLCENIERE